MIVTPSPSRSLWVVPVSPEQSDLPQDSPLGSPLRPFSDAVQVGTQVASGLIDRVSSGLVQQKIGQNQGGQRLCNDRSPEDGAHA